MERRIRKLGPALWLALGFIVWLAAFAGAKASAPQVGAAAPPAKNTAQTTKPPQPVPQLPAPTAGGDRYIGETACVDCHDSQKAGYFNSKHHRSADPRTPAAKDGCETCHGPGGKHSDDPQLNPIPNDFKKMKPAEVSAICTTCHYRSVHALWDGSQHEMRGVTCTNCHANHAYKSEKAQLKEETQAQVCAACHRGIVNKQSRFNHMPVREGKLECSNCHNPHGSANVKLLKVGTTVDEACTSCHSEKRGPYLWEHAPVVNACVTCHDPHGSNNERLLVAKVPFLCQRCHVTSRHPPTVYEGFGLKNSPSANRLTGQGCVVCHVQIHGSNAPSGKYFHR
jgi:DmsE family decaheme c-type cytochrome